MHASTDLDAAAKPANSILAAVCSPLAALALALALLSLLLTITIPQPIGPMFWDHYLYLDAANRLGDGQIPSVDFFAPVGALGYYLFAALQSAFPSGHPLLLASWCLLVVTGPLIGLVTFDLQKRSRTLAYAILLPFLLFSLLPFNTGDFYPYPGSDGFGIYNRQVCQLLYVLAAALIYVRNPRILIAVAAGAMIALFFVKVTGAVAGVILCLTAFAAGRLSLRSAVVAALIFFGILAVIELSIGAVSAYVGDILALLDVNGGILLTRLLQAVSLNAGLLVPASVLCLTLFFADRPTFVSLLEDAYRRPSIAALGRVFDQDFFWLGTFVVAGILFESQNTGSQAFIFLYPLLLRIALDYATKGKGKRLTIAVWLLAIAAALPPMTVVVQKSARAWVGAANNIRIESRNLKTMGAVNVRPIVAARAERMRNTYIAEPGAFKALADQGELPSFLFYSDFDFQTGWLTNVDNAIDALRAYEDANGVRFDTIFNIDFANPFPWLMDRHAPKHVAIGADPFRAIPEPDQDVRIAVAAVDIALVPTCPTTNVNRTLLALYLPSLEAAHTRIKLTPCYDALVRNGLNAGSSGAAATGS